MPYHLYHGDLVAGLFILISAARKLDAIYAPDIIGNRRQSRGGFADPSLVDPSRICVVAPVAFLLRCGDRSELTEECGEGPSFYHNK